MAVEIDELDKAIIREVQAELPLVERPYLEIAQRLEISEEELLDRLRKLKQEGKLRRLGVILYHRQAGYEFNGMGAWIVPAEKIEEVGAVMASYQKISHVYERPTYPDWPYNLFSMVHGQSQAEVEGILEEISQKTGIKDYRVLYSTEELKKVSMKYFCEEDSN
ncbi:siroheme decarboxylase subunit beta [Fuchsiella alkaliacetigena]|uniref:siroheme decarboxylase subunit beta n=1 Tax=Fuchsiella alkaliacetigena TaxID=957042 RepID=UPI00200B21A3|nr:AsnC family transcriptional regulator [Fuchsiella alkaliacetigena]MCK8824451.1 AsnC family transcriptional regulator [Fuchsiella alkaliacetigena]